MQACSRGRSYKYSILIKCTFCTLLKYAYISGFWRTLQKFTVGVDKISFIIYTEIVR